MSNNWTWQDYDYLYNNYNKIPAEEIAAHLGRSVTLIHDKAAKLGLYQRDNVGYTDIVATAQFGKQLRTAMIFLLPHLSVGEVEVLLDEYAPEKGKPRSKPPVIDWLRRSRRAAYT